MYEILALKMAGNGGDKEIVVKVEDEHINNEPSEDVSKIHSCLLISHYRGFMLELYPKIKPIPLNVLEKTPFGHYLNMPHIASNSPLITWLISLYDMKVGKFKINDEFHTFSDEWISKHTWLPNHGQTLLSNEKENRLWDVYIKPKKESDNPCKYLEALLSKLAESDDPVIMDDFAKLAIAYQLMLVWLPTSLLTIPRRIFHYLTTIEIINNVNWAKAVHDNIVEGLGRRVMENKEYVVGCQTLLALWYFEKTGLQQPDCVQPNKPPMLHLSHKGSFKHKGLEKKMNNAPPILLEDDIDWYMPSQRIGSEGTRSEEPKRQVKRKRVEQCHPEDDNPTKPDMSAEELEPLFDYSRTQPINVFIEDDDDLVPLSFFPGGEQKRNTNLDLEDGEENKGQKISDSNEDDKETNGDDWMPLPPPLTPNPGVEVQEAKFLDEIRLRKQELASFAQPIEDVLKEVMESAKKELHSSAKDAVVLDVDPPSKPERHSLSKDAVVLDVDPPSKPERQKVVIYIQDKDGRKPFRMYMNDKLERMFKIYADKVQLKFEDLVFCFDGDKINPCATPSAAGLENDDIIEVHMKSH